VERGSGRDPLPIVLTHGWPGSVFELISLVEPLAHPERVGRPASDAFTVIVPSLPGFGFSSAPDRVLSPHDVAAMWHELMTERLGFSRYVAHGGDTGATVTSWLGLDYREIIPAIHLNTAVLQAQWTLEYHPLQPAEKIFLAKQTERLKGEDAYQRVHAEKPATLSFGLADSPVGLAAWILEKFHGWTVPGERVPPPLELDLMIANIMTYWLFTPQPVHWMYQSLADLSGYRLPPGRRVETPTGFCLFPKDIVVPPPRAWLERAYNVSRITLAADGGHFPGMQSGTFLADDVRDFFRPFRN
jgi:microsomal epoxide hydrolase